MTALNTSQRKLHVRIGRGSHGKLLINFFWHPLPTGGIVRRMPITSVRTSARLVPLSGPSLGPIELAPKAGGLLAGRQDQCDLRLTADTVSRNHARFVFESNGWRLI